MSKHTSIEKAKEGIVTTTISDAISKHHIAIDKNDLNIKDLVRYSIQVGYSQGWREHRTFISKIQPKVRAKKAAQLKQAILLLERALCAGGSCKKWMEDTTTFVKSITAKGRK